MPFPSHLLTPMNTVEHPIAPGTFCASCCPRCIQKPSHPAERPVRQVAQGYASLRKVIDFTPNAWNHFVADEVAAGRGISSLVRNRAAASAGKPLVGSRRRSRTG